MNWIYIGDVLEIYWRCIGDMLDAKVRIIFESSKQNARNLIHFTENGCNSSQINAVYPKNL